jgi:hypothetical protein
MIRRLLRAPALLALPLALVVGACTEDLDTAAGCPVLCPGQTLDILDTVIDPAMVIDTTLGGFPLQGFENPLLLASRGDSLDVRVIVRFDTLTRFWTPAGDTLQPVTFVDSASFRVRLFRSSVKVPNQFTLEAYDVGDTTLVDSLPSTLLPYFVPERLLGSKVVDSADFRDSATVQIPLDTALLREIVTTGQVLRIGLRVRSTESAAFYVSSSDDESNGPRVRYRISPDTAVAIQSIAPSSSTPANPVNLNGDLLDYLLVASAVDPREAGSFAVGGMPSFRTYLRFDLPAWLTDSSAVLRAQLELVQSPFRAFAPNDSVTIRAQLVLAGHATTDLNRAARLTAPFTAFAGDSLRRAPGDSGVVRFELNTFVRAWRNDTGFPDIPQAIVLRSDFEGFGGAGLRFYGLGSTPALRPRLRVSYVPNIRFGQP